jgi:hypothetical protein
MGARALALVLALGTLASGGQDAPGRTAPAEFPHELVRWQPYPGNPLFAGSGGKTWDRVIRERGLLRRDRDGYRLWYTGYDPQAGGRMKLGVATSADGLRFTRHPRNPVFDAVWTEDVFVVEHDGVLHMFAEGENDIAHRLTSKDGLTWKEEGRLDVRLRSGAPIPSGAYGTPTVWVENGTWHLFYEREDRGIWLATSRDLATWTNVQDAPVIGLGPEAYDRHAVALNQVVRHRGRYYGVYHANADPEWKGPWTTCLAVSDDLVRWRKYPGNPVIAGDHSSGILVPHGAGFRLYTMHPDVRLWLAPGDPLAR